MKPTKEQAVFAILKNHSPIPKHSFSRAWASTNIALCKYWGKRDDVINLPLTDSLSILLPKRGVHCELSLLSAARKRFLNSDHPELNSSSITINNTSLNKDSFAAIQLKNYVNLFLKTNYELKLDFNIPIAAGFASSAACYASIIQALDSLFEWNLSKQELSTLARLGSGSACRSIEPGFSVWQAGIDPLGRDSFSHALPEAWPDFSIGLYVISTDVKPISSREGMKRTRETSKLYSAWPKQVEQDIPLLIQAIKNRDFNLLGQTAEHNSMTMHATMESAWPPLVYTLAETRSLQQLIWDWRADGKAIYFTQDAGPNLKLLFEKKDTTWLQKQLPELQVIHPFEAIND